MSEMVQTERDYTRSLQYIIENYIPELQRVDVPQLLRGKRNVIFGNVEKIYQFHSQYFLRELEACEHNPFLVGHYFLRHVRKCRLLVQGTNEWMGCEWTEWVGELGRVCES